MKEAYLYKTIDHTNLAIKCDLCCHNCTINNGQFGVCKVRKNINGVLFSLVYGSLVSQSVDPIEKKPIFHCKPGSLSYSIATVGCNFKCKHCQNHNISQFPVVRPGVIPGTHCTPEQIVNSAITNNCQSISYTYVEPTIFFEFAYETSIIAKSKNLHNIFVSNGYTSQDATKKIAPFLTANNIDLKSFSDKFYREICSARLAPVLNTISKMKELGVWVEVTTLIIPDLNDSDRELQEIAKFLVSISPDIPWHVSRFHPTYRLTDRGPTPASSLHRAREIGAAEGLNYIYTGNIPGQGSESSFCPNCKNIIIERIGYHITNSNLTNGCCTFCNAKIPGIW